MASGFRIFADVITADCKIHLKAFTTSVDLRVIPLGSYDIVFGMDWLERHNAVMDCKDKTIRCLDDSGSARVCWNQEACLFADNFCQATGKVCS